MNANGTGNGAAGVGGGSGEAGAEQGSGQAVSHVDETAVGRSRADALHAFDLDGFIRTARETRGVIHLGELPRMRDLVPAYAPATAADSPLRWQARGEMRKVMRRRDALLPASSAAARPAGHEEANHSRGAFQSMQPHLTLSIDGAVWLECQRCMQPFSWPVSVEAGYRVARDEYQADALAGDDADEDVIVGSPAFDLLDLIDEEIVLSLPMVPKHRVCPAVHVSVVSGADGALGVDRVEDIEARLADEAGSDPAPLPGERAADVEADADEAPAMTGVPVAGAASPTRKPFAAALAGWQPASKHNASANADASAAHDVDKADRTGKARESDKSDAAE
ncbi:DUF177 domain-containing protein [Robbsia andropogonis]|uniref:DUF177 domain-containing protein n=1 Tax=Robbsia andropogonis TaxID=28092 RepID=UPI003D1AE117